MQEGRKNRAELIKELKQADEWKSSVATEEEKKLIENYEEVRNELFEKYKNRQQK